MAAAGHGDETCTAFLKWALPQLQLRWAGYRKVRRTVCKRLRRRLRHLGLSDLDAYRGYLSSTPDEWQELERFCRIPISRFYRDKGVFDTLGQVVLPALAAQARSRGDHALRIWCAGCASGEEAYSLAILWHRQAAGCGVDLDLLASDAEPVMIERARTGCYAAGALRDMPPGWLGDAFEKQNDDYCVRADFRRGVRFVQQDLRRSMPAGPFDLICCRNLAFTYFAPNQQCEALAALLARLRPDGYLVIGAHERLPDSDELVPAVGALPIYRRAT